MSDCKCPYCDKIIDDPDDCYEPDEVYSHECPYCGKNFVFTIDYIRVYSERRADCLNGGEHQYEETKTWPKEFTRLCCKLCGDEKPISLERKAEIIKNK